MNKPRWRKIFADIMNNKMRSIVVLASITIGVFAIGLIGTMIQLILEESHQSYESANPANIKIQMMDFGDDFIKSASNNINIEDIEGRRVIDLSMINKSNESTPFQVIAVDNLEKIQISTPYFVEGSNHLDEGEIVVALEFLEEEGYSIGETLSIELANGQLEEFSIVGIIEDWTLEINQIFFNKGLGFISMDSLSRLNEPFAYNTLLATVSSDPNNIDLISQANDDLINKIESTGRFAYTSKLSQTNVTPLNSIIVSLLSILIFLGILIMLLSGFLIANTMNSLLIQQSRQIGVMKLVGAKRNQIIMMYLSLSMIYGVVAMLIAIPSGLFIGRFVSEFITDLINCQITDVKTIPFLPLVIITQIFVAIIVPLLASLLPVLRGTRTTVKKALSGNLVSNDIEETKFDHWLDRLPVSNGIYKISIRNTFRRKGRLFTTIFALALAGAIFIAVFNTQGSLNQQTEDSARLMGVDLNIHFNKDYNQIKIEELLMSHPDISYAEAWGTSLAFYDNSLQEESVLILAPKTDSKTINPTLTSGRWFVEDDQRAIIVNENFMKRDEDLRIGSQIILELNGKEKEWSIIGTTSIMGDDDLEAYISFETWEKELKIKNSASTYRLILEDHSIENQLIFSNSLYQWLENSGYSVSTITSVKNSVNNAVEMTNIIIYVLLILALLSAFVSSIGMTGTLGMNILERTSEIGILRAIGGNNQVIKRLVMIEGIIIGGISYLLSIVFSFPVTFVLKSMVIQSIFGTNGKLIIAWQGFVLWFLVAMIFSVFASVIPARDATRLTIREVLAYE